MGASSGSTHCQDRDASALWSTPLVGLVPALNKQGPEGGSLLPHPYSLCSAVGTSARARCTTLELPPWAPGARELPARQRDHCQPGQADPDPPQQICI